jgi:CheY-like chemotaxis protein
MERIYTVDVIGFNATERILLGSVFGLSLKRSPSYRRAEPGETAQVRLVDGAQPQGIEQALARQSEQPLPVVLVGAAELPQGWFETPRPLHWARLFRAMDLSLGLLTHGPIAAQTGARLAPPRGERSWSGEALHSMQEAITASFDRGEGADERSIGLPLLLVSDPAGAAGTLPLGALQACGRRVEVVGSTIEAMARLTKKDYAFILIDLALPAGGAQALCRAVAAHPGPQVLPRILYKVQASTIDRVRAALIDCEAFVATGTGGEELAATVLRIGSRAWVV